MSTSSFFGVFGLKAYFSTEITQEIAVFLMGDKRSPAFARYLRHVLPGRNDCLRMLETAGSRKNGFAHIPEPEEEDTEDPHWVYYYPFEVDMQSVNCTKCGDYIWSNTMGQHGISMQSVCVCDTDF